MPYAPTDAERRLRRPPARVPRDEAVAADAPSAARCRDRPRHLRQAREPQPDRRVQGARRAEPHRAACRPTSGAASSPRRPATTASRSRWRASAKACRARSSCRSATTPRRTRRCARTAPSSSSTAGTSTRRASASEQLQHERGLRYVHSANEPLLHRRRRHLRARDVRGAARRRRHDRADRRRERRVRLLPRPDRRSAAARRSSACRPSGADAFTRSWRTGTRVVGEQAETFAEGMATRVTFDLTFEILRRELERHRHAQRGRARRRRAPRAAQRRTTWPKAPAPPRSRRR